MPAKPAADTDVQPGACVTDGGAVQAMQQVGAFVHRLYRAAHRLDVVQFDGTLLALLREVLHHDAAWLGHSTLTPAGPVMHSSLLQDLPPDYELQWQAVQAVDPLVPRALSATGQAVVLSIAEDGLMPAYRAFLARNGVAQVLCIADVEPVVRTCVHLSLYRCSLKPVWNAAEQGLLAALIPNIGAAVAVNRMREVDRVRSSAQASEVGVALLSQSGVVQTADPLFGDFLLLEWPQWPGGLLPAELKLPAPGQRTWRHVGRLICLDFASRGALVVATARQRGPSSVLSPREHAVALQFAQGHSYKEVAKALNLAPATVRHHLRQVYAKLGIQDKGAIAWALSRSGA
jgi:DNA-binding CsgD family transcriptional regulator